MISIITEDTDFNTDFNTFYYKTDAVENEKQYKILDDIENIELHGHNIVLSINLLSNETLKINSLKIPDKIKEYLNDIYITENNNNIIYNKTNYINNIINTNNNTQINLVFSKNYMSDIIGCDVILNYTIICKKSKSKVCLLEDYY
jgi:hypothetical protein